MDLTQSHIPLVADNGLDRFDYVEVRNAAAIIASTSPSDWKEICSVLSGFQLQKEDILDGGGNKSDLASRLDLQFRELGWREGRVDTVVKLAVKLSPYRNAGETDVTTVTTEVTNQGYKVDNFRGRIALDIEWNAKDGNLDRDIAAYRALYDAAVIDAAVIITRTQEDLRKLALSLDASSTKFATTTTTNLEKLIPRMTRGDAGGCPLLGVAITSRCFSPVNP